MPLPRLTRKRHIPDTKMVRSSTAIPRTSFHNILKSGRFSRVPTLPSMKSSMPQGPLPAGQWFRSRSNCTVDFEHYRISASRFCSREISFANSLSSSAKRSMKSSAETMPISTPSSFTIGARRAPLARIS